MEFRRIAMVLVTASLVAASAVAAAPPVATPAIETVTALENARRQAMVAGDIPRLTDLFAKDATYVHSTGLVQTRDELLSVLERGAIHYRTIDVDSVSYRAYGPVVVGNGVQTLHLEASGKPVTARSGYTVVYAPVDGQVRLIAYQSTNLPRLLMEQKTGTKP